MDRPSVTEPRGKKSEMDSVGMLLGRTYESIAFSPFVF